MTRHIFGNDVVRMANYSTDLHTVNRYDFPEHKPGWYDNYSEFRQYKLNDIVAWMPTPEPYRTESEDKE